MIGRIFKTRFIIYNNEFSPIAEVGNLEQRDRTGHIRFTGIHYDRLLLTGE